MHNGIRPTIYYCNPNIFPEEEYLIRKNECTRYAEALGLDIVDADYDHGDWLEWVRTEAAKDGCADVAAERERGGRCLECFRYRLLKSAEYAASHGFPVLTTTLASSRWKSLEQINNAGLWAVAQVKENAPLWWDRNWRKEGLQERRNLLIREYGFYNQTWCGCEFSARQADDTRSNAAD